MHVLSMHVHNAHVAAGSLWLFVANAALELTLPPRVRRYFDDVGSIM